MAMDAFDQYLFDELTKQYAPRVLPREELESIYIRMKNLEELEELKPYLYAMRYFGWGTEAEPEQVLSELKDCQPEQQPLLAGLYQDLIISTGKGTEQNKNRLEEARKKGYTGVYLKQKSALAAPEKKNGSPAKDNANVPKSAPAQSTPAKPGNKLNITRVALFQSTRNKAKPEDTKIYSTAFSARNLDALYIKTMFDAPGTEMRLNYRIKIENLNTNKVFHEGSGVMNLGPKDTACWIGVWMTEKVAWPTARYRYTWELGGSKHQILFTVS